MRTRDPTRWMWEEACEMLERAERMQRQFFQVRAEARRGPTWEPPVDIVETDRELSIVVALPGVRPADMDVLIEGGMLVVTGARALPSIPDGAVIHRLEIPHGDPGSRNRLVPRLSQGMREGQVGYLRIKRRFRLHGPPG